MNETLPEVIIPKRKVGRPSEYDPAYCIEAIEVMSRGLSLTAFAGHIGKSRECVWSWAQKYEEFASAIKEGQAACALYWENQLARIGNGAPGNVTAAIFALKNRARDDWNDRIVTEHAGTIGVSEVDDKELARRVAYMLAEGNG